MLHVYPDETAGRLRLLQDPLQVRFAEALVDLQAKLGQLDREVALKLRGAHLVNDRPVGRRRFRRRLFRPNMLAQIVERVRHPVPFDGARRFDGLRDVAPADEPSGGGARAAHAVARCRCLQQAAVGGGQEEPAGEPVNKQG